MFTSGPPELPGLIAASVWMKSKPGVATVKRRALAAHDPERHALLEPERAGRAPARTRRRAAGSNRRAGAPCRPEAPSIFRSARSTRLSRPITLPWNRLPPFRRDLDGRGAVDHVGVGDDQPARIDDKARAGAAPGLPVLLAWHVLLTARCTLTWTSAGLEPLGEIGEQGVDPRQIGRRARGRVLAPRAPPPVDGPAQPHRETHHRHQSHQRHVDASRSYRVLPETSTSAPSRSPDERRGG